MLSKKNTKLHAVLELWAFVSLEFPVLVFSAAPFRMLSLSSDWFLHASAVLIPTHQHFTAISFAILSLSCSLVSFPHHFIVLFCLHGCIQKTPLPHPVDVWSVGCIVAEMIRGSVLFPGTDRILPRHWFLAPSFSIIHSVLIFSSRSSPSSLPDWVELLQVTASGKHYVGVDASY